jgi:hypothetical protein
MYNGEGRILWGAGTSSRDSVHFTVMIDIRPESIRLLLEIIDTQGPYLRYRDLNDAVPVESFTDLSCWRRELGLVKMGGAEISFSWPDDDSCVIKVRSQCGSHQALTLGALQTRLLKGLLVETPVAGQLQLGIGTALHILTADSKGCVSSSSAVTGVSAFRCRIPRVNFLVPGGLQHYHLAGREPDGIPLEVNTGLTSKSLLFRPLDAYFTYHKRQSHKGKKIKRTGGSVCSPGQ